LQSPDLKEPGLKEFVEAHRTRPFVVIVKPGPISVQPTITALVAPLDSGMTTDPVKDLEIMAASGGRAFKDYQILEKARSVGIGGRDGAYCKAVYSAPLETGEGVRISFQTWVIVRGAYYFLISAVSRQVEDESTEKEMQQIVSSFKIEDAPSQSESGDRALMHAFQDGSTLVFVVLIDSPSGPAGHIDWTSSPPRHRDFEVTRQEFDEMWSTLMSTGESESDSEKFDGVNYYAFSTGYMPDGEKRSIVIPKAQASASIVALARKLRAYAVDQGGK
jgi:hypothetical protein